MSSDEISLGRHLALEWLVTRLVASYMRSRAAASDEWNEWVDASADHCLRLMRLSEGVELSDRDSAAIASLGGEMTALLARVSDEMERQGRSETS